MPSSFEEKRPSTSNSKELHVFEVSKDNFFFDFLSSFTRKNLAVHKKLQDVRGKSYLCMYDCEIMMDFMLMMSR